MGRLRVSTGRMAKTIGIAFMVDFASIPKPHRRFLDAGRRRLSGKRRGAGMDGCLTKPIRPQELDEILEGYLARRSAPAKTEEIAGQRK